MKMPNFTLKRGLKLSALSVLLIGASLGGYAGFLQLTGNFHPVVPGELYRSAQPSAAQLARYVQENGIKTVINLRGAEEKAGWYAQEVAEAQRLGVQHIDFRMSSSTELSTDKADQLVAIMRAAPKPILIHCAYGADRSGLASVIYSHQIAGIDEKVAERQLSFFYGHVSLPYLSAAYAMDESWQKLEGHFSVKAEAEPPSALRQIGG